ncbi:hypothetical protein BDR22DRAFT_877472 [Usnea florida]
MAPQFQDLPDELLVQVLGYLSKSHLKSARLSCTRCGRIGAQWLFQRVYFAPRQAAIDTFLSIFANPIFAKNVTELVYDGRLFVSEFTDPSRYKTAFDNYLRSSNGHVNSIVNRDAYHEVLAKSLIRYTSLYDQQQRILQDHEDYEALLTGLNNFPNITTVTALGVFSQSDRRKAHTTNDHSWYARRSRLEMAEPIPPKPWTVLCGDTLLWDLRGIQKLVRAVAKRCQNVKHLYIGENWEAPMTIFKTEQDGYNDVCTLARRLTCLSMNLYTSRRNDEGARQTQYNCLEAFLSQTKELRCLSMTGNLDGDVFKNTMWPHLEILRMEQLTLDPAQLKRVIQTHKDTLHTLILFCVKLTEDAWLEIAIEVGKYLKLRRIDIGSTIKGQTGWEVARSFMQSVPQTKELDKELDSTDHPIIIACPGEGVPRNVHDDGFLSRIHRI